MSHIVATQRGGTFTHSEFAESVHTFCLKSHRRNAETFGITLEGPKVSDEGEKHDNHQGLLPRLRRR